MILNQFLYLFYFNHLHYLFNQEMILLNLIIDNPELYFNHIFFESNHLISFFSINIG